MICAIAPLILNTITLASPTPKALKNLLFFYTVLCHEISIKTV